MQVLLDHVEAAAHRLHAQYLAQDGERPQQARVRWRALSCALFAALFLCCGIISFSRRRCGRRRRRRRRYRRRRRCCGCCCLLCSSSFLNRLLRHLLAFVGEWPVPPPICTHHTPRARARTLTHSRALHTHFTRTHSRKKKVISTSRRASCGSETPTATTEPRR